MFGDLNVQAGVVIPEWELAFTATRSSGPGGQHVNKTSSRVTLRWSVRETSALGQIRRQRVLERLANRLSADGALLLHVDETRSQHRNKEIARQRLAALLNEALKLPKRRIGTRPTLGAKKRRLGHKRARSSVKSMRRKPKDDS